MVRRFAESSVRDALQDTPVVLIHGPRQAGKSTLAQELSSKADEKYITLDDPMILDLARRDPSAFLDEHKPPLIIDEIQRAPELFLPMKAHVDRERTPGKYLLTGSANVLSLPKIADSLAGRMEIVDLLPLCQAEIEGTGSNFVDQIFREVPTCQGPKDTESQLLERLVRGGFPEPCMRVNTKRREAWFASYVRTMLERDVRDLASIDALSQMPRLLSSLASKAGTTMNISSLARDTSIPNTTLTRYVDLLKAIFMVHLVPAWSHNPRIQFIKSPKAYLVDTGLLCYLANIDEAMLKADRQKLEMVLENFVAMELKKLISASHLKPWLLHLRTVRHLQVDFVMEARSGSIIGVQVKSGTTLNSSDADGLRFLSELAGKQFKQGIVLYLGDEVQPMDRDIVALPLRALWQA